MKTCKNGCCQYIINNNYKKPYGPWKIQRKKAGIINYWYEEKNKNGKGNKVISGINTNRSPNLYFLLVNSAGWKWGFPKGSIEEGESSLNGAIREYIEETGLNLSKEDLVKDGVNFLMKSSNRVKYYFTNKKGKIIPLTSAWSPYNDSTGIGIFNHKCLCNGDLKLELNLSCEKVINNIIKLDILKDDIDDSSFAKLTL